MTEEYKLPSGYAIYKEVLRCRKTIPRISWILKTAKKDGNVL